jgi:hypothetical protein
VCLTLSEIRLKKFTSVKNSVKGDHVKRATKGFDVNPATPIRETDLDGFYRALRLGKQDRRAVIALVVLTFDTKPAKRKNPNGGESKVTSILRERLSNSGSHLHVSGGALELPLARQNR